MGFVKWKSNIETQPNTTSFALNPILINTVGANAVIILNKSYSRLHIKKRTFLFRKKPLRITFYIGF